MLCQPFCKQVVCQFASFLKGIDSSLGDFKINPTIVRILCKVVLIDEFLWDVGQFDLYVFWPIQWHAKVEIGDIKACEAGLFGGKYVNNDELNELEGSCFSSCITWVANEVSPDGDSGPIGIFFLRPDLTHNASVSDVRPSFDRKVLCLAPVAWWDHPCWYPPPGIIFPIHWLRRHPRCLCSPDFLVCFSSVLFYCLLNSVLLDGIKAVILLAGKQIHKYTIRICEVFFVRECLFVYSICTVLYFLAQNPRMHGYFIQNDHFFICVFVNFYLWHK